MTAGHEDARDTGGAGGAGGTGGTGGAGGAGEQHGEYREYGGYGEYRAIGEHDDADALMAAITGDPLPQEVCRDPARLAAHRAAEADVAVLRDQLAWLAEALTGEETARGAVAGAAVIGGTGTPQGAGGPEGPGTAEGPGPAVPPARRARSRTRPAGPGRPPEPGRPGGRRRALRIALGSLAGAAAFALVLGFGWVVTRAGGGADDSAGAAAKSDAGVAGRDAGPAGRPADPERELACSRLVVEGTVAQVEPRPGTSGGSSVTLTVLRSYKPAHGPAEVRVLLDAAASPAPRPGQHVLVLVGRGERDATRWVVGDIRVAVERDWITDALPGSLDAACPSGGAS
ncbi:hypothetical protein ACFC09_11075 [Streptomyces sp. NPDC056161]|uniref:hypothetical protein n=1 Tax=Streptomyces sp. NPDC056161 TaxID=3345732 RepID=UPI0035E353C5